MPVSVPGWYSQRGVMPPTLAVAPKPEVVSGSIEDVTAESNAEAGGGVGFGSILGAPSRF